MLLEKNDHLHIIRPNFCNKKYDISRNQRHKKVNYITVYTVPVVHQISYINKKNGIFKTNLEVIVS